MAEPCTRREGRGCTGNGATRERLMAAAVVVVVEFGNASLIELSWNDHNAPGKHEVWV